ncbi:type II toxin-antitoxin system HipA family toxin [Variovorax sp. YR216]|uniref:type II toxin-antitoxin system HipA family toxin n=1 Tax=Variovorax sp. YR216 TaxID=1882828 RepID=UPI00089BC1AE|nr:type II toxin-antitoxin system HipA family toxin [Variovorax sp. YR216]SEB22505.1 serine/threonine-protein kinase HipA [Variovorax sp. YR216]
MNDLLAKIEANAKRLDVHVGPGRVGTLEREGAQGSVFAYLPETNEADFVSLLMPVRLQSYSASSALIPVFQQNLPEGFLRRKITQRFGKVLATDDLILLALTGANMIGRQKIVPSGFSRDWIKPLRVDVEAMMADSQAGVLFAELLDEFIGFGVSGALPKVLVQERDTIHDAQWILKVGDTSLPSLAVNEYFTMRAAAHAGLPTPEFTLSEEGTVFGVKRFDFDVAGNSLGFEDFCALLALPPERTYGGTMERVVKAIEAFTVGPERLKAKEGMIAAQLFSMAARNTDAHLKNFGLLYSGIGDARLAPMFDMVTTKVYPQYRNDIPSISIAGKKLDVADKTFVRFAQERGGMTTTGLRDMAIRIAGGLEEAAAELIVYGRAYPAHQAVCDGIVEQWKSGVQMLDNLVQGIGARRKPIKEEVAPVPQPKG